MFLAGRLTSALEVVEQRGIQFRYSAGINSTLSTFTFNNVDLGSPLDGRTIIVLIAATNGTTLASGVTVRGVSGTIIRQTSGGEAYAGIARVEDKIGGVGSVTVTFPTTRMRASIGVYRVGGIMHSSEFSTAITSSGGGSVTAQEVSIAVPNNGLLFAVASRGDNNNGSTTWTGVTEDFDLNTGARIHTGGSFYPTPQSAARTVRAQFSNNGSSGALVAVVF